MSSPDNVTNINKMVLIQKELHKIMEAIPSGLTKIILKNQQLFLSEANEDFYALPCHEKNDSNSDILSRIHTEDLPRLIYTIETQYSNGEDLNASYRIVGLNNQIYWFHLKGTYIGPSEGYPSFLCTIMDITEQKVFFEMFELEKDRYQTLLHLSDDVIMEHDVIHDVATFSDNSLHYFNHPLRIKNFTKYMSDTYEESSILYKSLLNFNPQTIQNKNLLEWECPLKVKSGESEWFRVKIRFVFKKGVQTTIVCKLTYVHPEKLERERLLEEASCDSVTGLFNKSKTHSKIERILQNKPEIPHLMGAIILDSYKDVSKRYGSLYANMILRDYAKGFKRILPNDCILGVIGEGMFLFFLPCENPATQSKIHLRKLDAETKQIRIKYANDDLRLHVGYCNYPDQGAAFDPLLNKAVHALFVARNKRLAGAFYHDGMEKLLADKQNELLQFYNEREDSKQFQNLFNKDITVFAFETLSSTTDTILAVRTILERLSEQMDVQCFHIIEHVSVLNQSLPTTNFGVESSYAVTFHWDTKYNLLSLGTKKIVQYPFAEMLKEFGEEGDVFSMEDCQKHMGNPSFTKLIQWVKAKALLGCGIYYNNELSFGICLYDNRRKRAWSEYDRRSLRIVTKLISSFMAMYHSNQVASNKIDHLLNYDKLTGLYAKSKFLELGSSLLAENEGKDCMFAVTYSDICNFKYLNDMYGYEAGDAVLKEFADMLKKPVSLGLDCRIHSDHFVSLVCLPSNFGLVEHITKVNKEFTQKIEKKYPTCNIVLSSGIYTFNNTDHNLTEAIDNANIARKEAKKHPKIGYKVFDDVLYRKQMRIGAIESCMHQALDNNEFHVYVQPKYDIADNTIIGGEALVRWIRPDGTMFYPDDFIPLFEQNGFIEEMDFYVLDKVCEKLNEYQTNGKKTVPISVNQSRYLLNNPEYVYRVKCTIEKHDVSPELVELEMTETMVMQNIESVIDVLYQLKAISVKLSIDDFGSGYSSLNLLKRLPVDIIKIDRTFLDDSVQSEPTRIIIESLVSLAKKLGIKPICEGIETTEQADFLRSISCNYVQGYLYAKPMPIMEYDKIINAL